MFWIPTLFRVFVFTFLFIRAHGFDFVVSPPTQCGSQRFTWVGGTPPFYALILPPDGTMRNISIPTSAWNQTDRSGDFSTVLPLAQGKMVVFSMGDAIGETTGGVSEVMTVGAPAAGTSSCNTTDPGPAFFFSVNSALLQCKNYPFSLFTGAVLPISVLVTVPHSESFIIHPPNNNDPFNWQANLTAGTRVLFTMSDAQGRPGGTSSLTTVQSSDDSSCAHPPPSSASPTRTPSPTGTAPATNTGGSGNNTGNNNHKGSNHTGLIIGVAVGGAVALIIVIALIYCFSKRKGGSFVVPQKRIDLTEPGPDSSSYLLPPGGPEPVHHPPPATFPPYRDTITPFTAGPSGVPPTTMYNNGFSVPSAQPLDSNLTMGTPMVAGIYGAAAGAGAAHSSQPPMTAKQREALQAQQRQQQYYQQQQHHHHQEYLDPYETGGNPPAASHSAYNPTASSRQTAQSDMLSQFGAASSSNFSSTVGPSTFSSGQSSSSKQRVSSTSPPPQPRVIVHRDIEDELIELPPMYSEAREPIHGMSPANAPQSGKGGMR
ncbi:hypothetical protein D9756_004125 [Leucocoprinus leucothites]|uniref:Uncharacterized protein n=1 Tax=Leucocoprinus leucothites TaxID=201217 RepID=A0A8H5DB16_9AGAR|nr:hypothetical protein D9756_004125 [Leucoagaricus leucothites]